jgi:hypothetical protein
MKKNTIALLALGAFSLLVMTSCTKSSVNTLTKSRTELLTQQVWKSGAHGLDANNNGVIDASENDMPNCQTDDRYSFYSNGNGLYSSGVLKCAADDSTTNFTWALSNNDTQLTIFYFTQTVSKLDDNTLEVYYEDQNSTGQTVKYITTYNH